MSATFKDIGVSSEGHVGIVEIQRPPHNFFDNSLINQIADAFEAFDRDTNIRSYVLCAQGKSFCAGADFANRPQTGAAETGKHLYKEATRLFRAKKPSVAAVQGPAIGGGLGLAVMTDFRVAAPEARSARLTRREAGPTPRTLRHRSSYSSRKFTSTNATITAGLPLTFPGLNFHRFTASMA